jgi:hypothetical protein
MPTSRVSHQRCTSRAERGNGLPWWVGASDRFAGSPRTIVGHAFRERGDNYVERGRLLTWNGREPAVVGEFQGNPYVVADFRGSGKPGVVVRTGGGAYALLEP